MSGGDIQATVVSTSRQHSQLTNTRMSIYRGGRTTRVERGNGGGRRATDGVDLRQLGSFHMAATSYEEREAVSDRRSSRGGEEVVREE